MCWAMDDKDQTCYIIGDTIILPFDLNDDDVLNVQNVPDDIRTKLSEKHSTSEQVKKNAMLHVEVHQSISSCGMAKILDKKSNIDDDSWIQAERNGLPAVNVELPIETSETASHLDSLVVNPELGNWETQKQLTLCREAELPLRSFESERNFHQSVEQFDSTELERNSNKLYKDSSLISVHSQETVDISHCAEGYESIDDYRGANKTRSFSAHQDITPAVERNGTFGLSGCHNRNSEQKIMGNSHWDTNTCNSVGSTTNDGTSEGHTNVIQNNSIVGLDPQHQEPLQPPMSTNYMLQDSHIENTRFASPSWTGRNIAVGGNCTNSSVSYDEHLYNKQCSGFTGGVNNYKVGNTNFEMPEVSIPMVGPYQANNGRVFVSPYNKTIRDEYLDRMNLCNIGELQPVYPMPALHPNMFPPVDGRYPLMPQPGHSNDFVSSMNLFPQTQFYQPYIEQPYFMIDGFNTPFNAPPNVMLNTAYPHDNHNARNLFPQGPTKTEGGNTCYIFPQLNGRNLFPETPITQSPGYFQGEEVPPDVPAVPEETEREKCSEEDSEEARLQRVLSMERALRSEMSGCGTETLKRHSSSKSKHDDRAQELDPKVRAEMQREEVANAAKAIFMKRTGTLFHWMHPGESKAELRSRVEEAWNKLSEKETNYYFSQVMGRCNSDFQTRPMVNPRLMELLNPKDVQKLSGIFNNDKGSQETRRDSKPFTADISFKQRQRSHQPHPRNARVTRGQSSSQNSGEDSSTPRKSSGRSRLSSKQGFASPSTDGRLSEVDREVCSSNDESCTHSVRSPSSSLSLADTAKRRERSLSNEVNQLFGNESLSSVRQKLVSKSRGPRGPYKKTVRRLMNITRSDDEWEPRALQDWTGLKESRCKDRDTEAGPGILNEAPKRKDTRGPRRPYKKRKQEGEKGKGRGRGRPPKRRMVSSEEDTSFDSSLNLDDCDSGRQSDGCESQVDDSLDPCVSRQCQSFSGKVKPSQELQEVLRSSSMATNSDEWSSQGNSPRRRTYERKAKSKSPQRTRAREKKAEAFLVESEAMQMQFYQEVSSEDENKPEVELASLPVTSAEVAVDSLRRQQGSASSSAQASSGSDNSDVDWSPRQLRETSGRSTRRGARVRRR